MFDKQLFNKICEAEFSIKELENFVHNIDTEGAEKIGKLFGLIDFAY